MSSPLQKALNKRMDKIEDVIDEMKDQNECNFSDLFLRIVALEKKENKKDKKRKKDGWEMLGYIFVAEGKQIGGSKIPDLYTMKADDDEQWTDNLFKCEVFSNLRDCEEEVENPFERHYEDPVIMELWEHPDEGGGELRDVRPIKKGRKK